MVGGFLDCQTLAPSANSRSLSWRMNLMKALQINNRSRNGPGTLLQQEFHLDIDLTELERFNSVKAVLDHVTANAAILEEPNDS